VTPNSGPLIPRRRLGSAFRELREARGETLQQTAKALMFSPSKLSRIENGQAGEPHPRDVRDLLTHFDVTEADRVLELEDLAQAGRTPGWWQGAGYTISEDLNKLIGYEYAATRIRSYSPAVVPGLLQTRSYATDTIKHFLPDLSAAEVAHQVDVRIERQRQLSSVPENERSTHWYVIPETVLHRQVGSPQTMQEQLKALIEASEDPRIDLYVVPFSAGLYEAVEVTALTVFSFAPPNNDIVMIERIGHVDFFDRPRTTKKYNSVLDRLSEVWLDQRGSRDFIAKVRREKWQEDQ
jgi:transcriptional regulator with XRE-family HTH domain